MRRLPSPVRLEVPAFIRRNPVAATHLLCGFTPWSGMDKRSPTYTGKPGQAELLEAVFKTGVKRLVCPTGQGFATSRNSQ